MSLTSRIDARIKMKVQDNVGSLLQHGFDTATTQEPPVQGYVDSTYTGGRTATVRMSDQSEQTVYVGSKAVRANDAIFSVGSRAFI